MKPLKILFFQNSLDTSGFLELLKDAMVIPLNKRNHMVEAKNYIHVSFTSHTSRIIRCLVRNIIITHLVENNLLDDTQHGFPTGLSCLSQL